MKRHLAITAVTLLCSATFFVVVCAGSDMNAYSNSSALVARPSKGTWSGTTYIVGLCTSPAGFLRFVGIGKGVSTLTGASDWYSTGCVNPVTGEGEEGDAVITAANGDALYLKAIIDFDFLNGTWLQSETITGGTGRFADATGESASSGTVTFTGETTAVWEGTNLGYISF